MMTADLRPPTPRVQTRRESEDSLETSISPSRRGLPRALPAFAAQQPLVSPSLTMALTPRGSDLPQGAAPARRFTFSEGGGATSAMLPPVESMRLLSAPAKQKQPFPHVPVTAALMTITAILVFFLPVLECALGAVLAFSSPQCLPYARGRVPFRTYGRGVFAVSFLLSLSQILGLLLFTFLPEGKMPLAARGARMTILFVALAAVLALFLSMIVLYLYGVALLVRAQDYPNWACPVGTRNTAIGIVALGSIFTPVILLCLGVLFFERENVKLLLSILMMTAAPLFSPRSGLKGAVTTSLPAPSPPLRAPAVTQHHQQPLPSPVTAAAQRAAEAHYQAIRAGYDGAAASAPPPPPLPPRASPPGQGQPSVGVGVGVGIALRRGASGAGGDFGSGAPSGSIGGGQPIEAGEGKTGTSGPPSAKGFQSFDEEGDDDEEADGKKGLLGATKAKHEEKDLLSLFPSQQPHSNPLPQATELDKSPHSARQ